MSRTPVRPQILDDETKKLVDRGHITSSSEFKAFVTQEKTKAERRKADLETEVERFEQEIRSRLALIADEEEIIQRADLALTISLQAIERPAPQLTPKLNDDPSFNLTQEAQT